MAIDSGALKAARLLLHGLGFTEEMQRADKIVFGRLANARILARALFMKPTLMLLDEPTNHLDLNAVIWLDDYLQKWKKTILIVSHDQDFMDSVCTDIIAVDQKQLFYFRGNWSLYKEQQEQHMLKMKKAWEKQEKELRALKKAGLSKKKAMEKNFKKKTRESGGAKKGKKKGGVSDAASSASAPGKLLTRPKDYEENLFFPSRRSWSLPSSPSRISRSTTQMVPPFSRT